MFASSAGIIYALRKLPEGRKQPPPADDVKNESGINPVNDGVLKPPKKPLIQEVWHEEKPDLGRLVERLIASRLSDVRIDLVLELPEDTEVEVFGQKAKLKGQVRLGTPKHAGGESGRKEAINPNL